MDAVRGIALIGMMGIHLLPAWTDRFEPTLSWLLFAGKSAALFAVLAGVSLAFSSGGRRPLRGLTLTAARAALAVRGVLILGIGLAIANVDMPAYIILAYYGVMFILAIPLLGLSSGKVAVTALAFALVGPVLMQALRDRLPEPGYDPTFATAFGDPAVFFSQTLLTGVYPALPWMAYICAGLAVGRLDLTAVRTQSRLLAGGAALAVAAWLLSVLALGPLGGLKAIEDATPSLSHEAISDALIWGPDPSLPTSSWWWLAIAAPHSTTPLDILLTIGTSLAAIGAVLLAARGVGGLLTPLAAAGSMTLTLYSAHLLILATGFLADEPYLAWGLQVAAALVFAVVWQKAKGRGPLERMIAAATARARNHVLNSAAQPK
ncbi:heparan-alpha-glucosaminide N-acetyltransferase domain-containing protein [Arthrobacter sp. B3I4]|uniref:heparan-alpha-glucosaminide N-acetyltransferase domain-containing protein n=1 Tax=Arthrobacter sp. B3I4 TaxID=3042267 RepID=UPI0027D8003F|nr:heparan-alpha-glucosaminide N-acetyltransferase domain-containing protein [Arthrobacter sp. B3I4]